MHIYSIQSELTSIRFHYYCIKISQGSMCAVLEKTKTEFKPLFAWKGKGNRIFYFINNLNQIKFIFIVNAWHT